MRLIVSLVVLVALGFSQGTSRPVGAVESTEREERDELFKAVKAMSVDGANGDAAIRRVADAAGRSQATRQAFGVVMSSLAAIWAPLREQPVPESRPAPSPELPEWIDALLRGDSGRSPELIKKIIGEGMKGYDLVKKAYSGMSYPYGLILARELNAAEGGGFIWKGQYKNIADFGPTVRPVLANLVSTSKMDQKIRALRALRDITAKPEEDLHKFFRMVATTKMPVPTLQMIAACALADWGDRLYLETGMASAKAKTEDSEPSMRFTGWSLLFSWNQELRDAVAAGEAFDHALIELEAGKPQGGPARFIYNGACAHAVAGHDARALELLALAVRRGRADKTLIAHKVVMSDPDLAHLRGTEGFDRLIRELFPAVATNPAPAGKP